MRGRRHGRGFPMRRPTLLRASKQDIPPGVDQDAPAELDLEGLPARLPLRPSTGAIELEGFAPTIVQLKIITTDGPAAIELDGFEPATLPEYQQPPAPAALRLDKTFGNFINPKWYGYVYSNVINFIPPSKEGWAFLYANVVTGDGAFYVYANVQASAPTSSTRPGTAYVYAYVPASTVGSQDGYAYTYSYLNPSDPGNVPPGPGGSGGGTPGEVTFDRSYTLQIDLDGDGACETDVTDDVQTLSWNIGRQSDEGESEVGTLDVELYSEYGKYQVARESSVNFPDWQVGRLVCLRVTVGSEQFIVFEGRIETIDNDATDDRAVDRRTIKFTAHDRTEWLQSREPKTLVLESQRYSDLLEELLTKSQYPGDHVLSTTRTESYLWWTDGSVLSAVGAIMESEFGFFWVDARGAAYYQDRHYRYTNPRSQTSQLILDGDVSVFSQQQNADDVVTEVRVTVTPLKEAEPHETNAGGWHVLWELDDPISIKPGATEIIEADFRGPAIDIQAPESTTDYKAKRGQTEVTSDLLVTFTPSATKADLRVTNTSAQALKVTKFRIRGIPLLEKDEVTKVANAGDSVQELGDGWILATHTLGTDTYLAAQDIGGDYEPNVLHLTPQLLRDPNVAQDIAWGIFNRRGVPRRSVTITIENVENELLSSIFSLLLSDRITVRVAAIDVGEDFWVEGITHDVTPEETDANHSVTMYLTPIDIESVWVLDEDELDSGTILGW